MYTCERCGMRFGRVTASDSCPRCLARDGVRVSLAFRRLGEDGVASGQSRAKSLETAVREQLARAAPEARRAPRSRGGLRDAA
jgi:hypothetical protein